MIGRRSTRTRTRVQRAGARVGVLAVAAVVSLGTSSCTVPRSYVALGDSYSSGPVIPQQQNNPYGCLRSDHNYAHLTDAQLKTISIFRDVSCSGATTDDMFGSQSVTPGPNPPPQLDAIDAGTAAVSLTVGGNDIGFVSIIENSATPVNSGTPCKDKYDSGGVDQLQQRIDATAPKIARVLKAIHAKAPNAKIFLLSYLDILPEDHRSCYPQMPIADGDIPYLRGVEHALNAMLAQQATANRSTYVDAYTPSIGHDACETLPTVRWVEPVVPVNPAAPVHPNAAGMQGYAAALVRAMHAQGVS